MQDCSNGSVMPGFTFAVSDTVVIEKMGQPEFSISGGDAEIEHHPDHLSLRIVNDQLVDLVLPFVQDAALFQAVTVWRFPAAEAAFFDHLAQSRFGSDGGLLTLAVRLPESDVVRQTVRM